MRFFLQECAFALLFSIAVCSFGAAGVVVIGAIRKLWRIG